MASEMTVKTLVYAHELGDLEEALMDHGTVFEDISWHRSIRRHESALSKVVVLWISDHGPNVSRIACDIDANVPRIETETYVSHEGDAAWWKEARVPEEAWSELARIEARPDRM